MENQTTSQPHNNPFAETWTKMLDEHMGRMKTIFDEAANAEKKGHEQASRALDEMGRLTRESMNYALNLSAEWRRLTLDAMKMGASYTTPKA